MRINKILITGGAGFIGSHVFDHFSKIFPDTEIRILDKLTYAANLKNIPSVNKNEKHKLIIGDICDLDLCLDSTQDIDLLLHLAAESHVDNSFEESMIFSKTNCLGTHSLMEAAKRSEVKKIIHVSTDEVYGENIDSEFTESDSLNPTNPYSASKAAAEMIVKSYHTSFDLPVTIVRANNIYGIRQFPEKIIPKFISRALNNSNLQIQGDGTNKRHYLSALDFASALEVICKKALSGEIYNIASDLELSNLEVAKTINNLIRKNDNLENIEFVQDRPFNDSRYAVDDSKLRNLGWKPMRSLIKDLPEIIQWYDQNPDWFN
jgi:dTDP-glucose 4,6-dehydratase